MHKLILKPSSKILVVMILSLTYVTLAYAQYPDNNAIYVQSIEQSLLGSEQQCKHAENQLQKKLIDDAIFIIDETKRAISALSKSQLDKALTAIERAVDKTDNLVAKRPEDALLPVDFKVSIIDTAPMTIKAINDISKKAHWAIDNRNYSEARVLFDGLRSEINIRTYNLPLASYPIALKESARLVEQRKISEAKIMLKTALNTLVVMSRTLPLPIIKAEIMLKEADKKHIKDIHEALSLLSAAQYELDRSKELGYGGKDYTYSSLKKSIEELKKEVKARDKNSASTFSLVKNKLETFFKHRSEVETYSY